MPAAQPLKNLLLRFIADSIPAAVRDRVAALPEQQRQEFVEAYNRTARSTATAYFLYLLVGAHYAYVGRRGIQIVFWVTLGGLLVWWVVDLFRIPAMIRRYNEEVARDIMRRLQRNETSLRRRGDE